MTKNYWCRGINKRLWCISDNHQKIIDYTDKLDEWKRRRRKKTAQQSLIKINILSSFYSKFTKIIQIITTIKTSNYGTVKTVYKCILSKQKINLLGGLYTSMAAVVDFSRWKLEIIYFSIVNNISIVLILLSTIKSNKTQSIQVLQQRKSFYKRYLVDCSRARSLRERYDAAATWRSES